MKKTLLLLAAAAALAACTSVNPATGNMVNITGVNLTAPMRHGEDCGIVGLPMGNHPSLVEAQRKGAISRLQYVEYQYKNYVFH